METIKFEAIKVLVLNASFEPLSFVTAKKALTLHFRGRADVVHTDGVVVHFFSGSLACPTVIRLKRYVNISHKGRLPFSRANVIKRDKHTCQYCGTNKKEMTIDHIVPSSKGGKSEWYNTVAACKKCNNKKGNMTLEESGMKLLSTPRTPTVYEILVAPFHALNSFKEEWAPYLNLPDKIHR